MKTHRLVFLFLLLFSFLVLSAVAQEEEYVYVTKTGMKYHAIGCTYLRKGATRIRLSIAAESYSPCSRCNPPVLATSKSELAKKRINTGSLDRPLKTLKLEKVDLQSSVGEKTAKPGETEIGTTPTGKTLYQGPRGGVYHYSKSGKKVYQKKK